MGIMMTLLSAAGSPYLRLRPTSQGAWAVETAVVSCALRDRASGSRLTVDLFSTVHLASGEYYAGIKDACTARYERVLFEMIADGSCFERGADGARRLVRPLQASDQQRVLAAQYGLTAQMDALDLCGDPFVHSDMLSAELGEAASSLATGGPLLDRAAEALGGLVRGASAPGTGAAARVPLRLAAWALPAPELLLLLDDWIASGGASPAPALRPIARAALRGDFAAARSLALAQTLAQGDRSQGRTVAGEMVRQRNARAVEEVGRAAAAGCSRVALLFGALHMRDMRQLLARRFDLEAASISEWRTAWLIGSTTSAEVTPGGGGGGGTAADGVVLLFAGATTLAFDAADWFDALGAGFGGVEVAAPHTAAYPTFGSYRSGLEPDASHPLLPYRPAVSSSADLTARCCRSTAVLPQAAVGGALLYFLRHAAVYATLSAYAFDWDRRWYVEQGSGGGGSQQEGGALDAPADALIRADSALLRAGREPEGPAGQGSARASSASSSVGPSSGGWRRGSRGFRERVAARVRQPVESSKRERGKGEPQGS
mmetsp:Transcript_3557/g.10348  ORF Transcript_3557/g.10348 Transcript_3557/m.10348 type:complete len:545 (+) Transcript_3557:147-1781(+)